MQLQSFEADCASYLPRFPAQEFTRGEASKTSVLFIVPSSDFPMPIRRHCDFILRRIDLPLWQSILSRRRLLHDMVDVEARSGFECRVLKLLQCPSGYQVSANAVAAMSDKPFHQDSTGRESVTSQQDTWPPARPSCCVPLSLVVLALEPRAAVQGDLQPTTIGVSVRRHSLRPSTVRHSDFQPVGEPDWVGSPPLRPEGLAVLHASSRSMRRYDRAYFAVFSGLPCC